MKNVSYLRPGQFLFPRPLSSEFWNAVFVEMCRFVLRYFKKNHKMLNYSLSMLFSTDIQCPRWVLIWVYCVPLVKNIQLLFFRFKIIGVTHKQMSSPLEVLFPSMEYIPRIGWLPDGQRYVIFIQVTSLRP